MRSKIFRQVVQKDRRLAAASQEIFVQHDRSRFEQGVRRDLCGVALRNVFSAALFSAQQPQRYERRQCKDRRRRDADADDPARRDRPRE